MAAPIHLERNLVSYDNPPSWAVGCHILALAALDNSEPDFLPLPCPSLLPFSTYGGMPSSVPMMSVDSTARPVSISELNLEPN
jgi:hypothetical protein